MSDLFRSVQPRPTDIFLAVMGMTGSGKSTFISLCTGEDVAIGHNLQACTQQVGIYKCQWSKTVDIYLVDTPGFDDTHRSDTTVLKEIATWLTHSYKENLKLSGIIYLHRVTDPRMGGSARKNIFMFRKLCGTNVLNNVFLVTTMWEVIDPSVGEEREKELIHTDDFWGILVQCGASFARHDNSRESALGFLKRFVKMEPVTMSIQEEMVNEHKTLDQTQAGIELESELVKEREKFTLELAETQEMMKEAIEKRDQESAQLLRQHTAEMQRKIDQIAEEREQLKISMQQMHAEKFAELEKRYNEQQELLRQREEMNEQSFKRYNIRQAEADTNIELIRQQLQKHGYLFNPDLTAAPVHHRKRSAPGRNRIKENACVSMFGTKYWFIGPAWDFHRRPTNLINVCKDHHEARLAAFGIGESWYYHYHVDNRCATRWSHCLKTHYPKLVSWLRKHKDSACPLQITLGTNGYFYARTQNGRFKYSLPQNAVDQGADFKQVRRVWLGFDNAYVMEMTNGKVVWNMAEVYQGLKDRIEEYARIKDIAMNIEDPECYIIISEKGDCGYRLGKGNRFGEFEFQEYMTKNFGNWW